MIKNCKFYPATFFYLPAICSAKINVGFALYGSSQTGKENFETTINFVANISKHLNVDTSETWIFLAYPNQKRVFKTKSDLDFLVPENEPFPNTADVHLGATLNAIREQFSEESSERGAVNVVISVTSHKSVDDIGIPAAWLKTSNVTSFALGIGSHYSGGQLKEIASDPDSEHFIELSAWSRLNEYFAETIATKICQGWQNFIYTILKYKEYL